MWEYIVELFSKPAIMLTPMEQIIITAILLILVILIFAIIFGIIALVETIQERKERKEFERKYKDIT